ncbi:MAG: DUF1329 domain-containing protein [Pseudomonadota bacterium]
MKRLVIVSMALMFAAALFSGTQAAAAVTAEQAAKLKTTLTPLGGEKAGNTDGTIPAWDGGFTTVSPDFKNGGRRPDPFAAEKPLFSITAKNMDQYAGKLTDGVKAMLKQYADTFRVDVYPTHRTAAAPQWVYDNTFQNATRATIVDGPGGPQPQGAYGGAPFPIPASGNEAIWNHLLRWRGGSWHFDATQYLITSDGKRVLITDGAAEMGSHYYLQGKAPEDFDGFYYLIRIINAGPPIRAGEAIVGKQNTNDELSATWVYLTGQRRVRKLPNACCDTPAPSTAGLMTFDELEVFSGRVGRFDWNLIGKQEMFIPYNSNRQVQPAKDADVLSERHLNPDYVRWELHRVWVVEATPRQGQRNTVSKARYYIDEDSWYAMLGDRWDAKGQLSRTLWQIPMVLPDMPGVAAKTFGFYDIISGSWYVNGLFNEKSEQYRLMPTHQDALFTSDALAGEGVR